MAADETAEELASRQCIPCHFGAPRLRGEELVPLSRQVPSWEVVNEHHLRKELRFPDFKTALDFTNKVGALAESVGHHPDILLAWGKVEITIWTHKIDGLTESDFVLAAKIDRL